MSSVTQERESPASPPGDGAQTIQGILTSPSSHYLILSVMGEGTYGIVAKCHKTATNQMVAVKIFKSDMTYGATNEIAALTKMSQFDPDRFNFVRCNEVFTYGENVCIEFEMLDMSLLRFLQTKPEQSLRVKEIRPILHQLAITLDLLHSQNIAHTDIKPDNIMLQDHGKQPLKVKLIDFGLAYSAQDLENNIGLYIQTRYYRSPEAILGLPIKSAADMWSLGCVAAELFLGFPLFPGSNEYNMLRRIIHARGEIPQRLLNKAVKTKSFFKRKKSKRGGHKCWWTLKSSSEFEKDNEAFGYFSSLCDILKIRPLCHQSNEDTEAELNDQKDFIKLLRKMLCLDADKRLKPNELLQHPFITMKRLCDNHPDSFYFVSSCETMEVCRGQIPLGNTADDVPVWESQNRHPLIPEADVVHEEQPEQPSIPGKNAACRSDDKCKRKRARSSSEASQSSNKVMPHKKKWRREGELISTHKESPPKAATEASPACGIMTRKRKRACATFTPSPPESRVPETSSLETKRRKTEHLKVQTQSRRKRMRETEDDQFGNNGPANGSPQTKRRKIPAE